MSNTKAFIDYAMQDNGSSAREALYSEIHDRVMAHIEAKKIEIAGGILTREEKSCDMDWDDKKKELKKATTDQCSIQRNQKREKNTKKMELMGNTPIPMLI